MKDFWSEFELEAHESYNESYENVQVWAQTVYSILEDYQLNSLQSGPRRPFISIQVESALCPISGSPENNLFHQHILNSFNICFSFCEICDPFSCSENSIF